MLLFMIAERRWMFIGLIVPGLIGCLASALGAIAARRRTGRTTGRSEPATGTAMASDSGDAALQARCAGYAMPLERLLGLRQCDASGLWRVIARRWDQATHMRTGGMRGSPTAFHEIPVGVGPDGRPVTVDLPRSGPHALVAGTTGSGKSVLLQSWCLGLALRFPPTMVNFVFLDFKGGAAFQTLHRLPHTVGFVSDLSLDHAVRALRAIEMELKRRERLVAEHHATDVDGLPSPPPRLIVVIDEFHALRQQLPDYMAQLVSLASLGRSLGMHLIACTQNPMGQVGNDMKANIGLNICLRVRDSLQSSELLGTADAAAISPGHPGVGYIHDGESRTIFRCAPPRSADALTMGCDRAARFLGQPDVEPLFSPPLPKCVPSTDGERPVADHVGRHDGHGVDALAPVPFGLMDSGVRTLPLELPLHLGNIAIIGATGRGKTSALRVIGERLRSRPGLEITRIVKTPEGYRRHSVVSPARPAMPSDAPPPAPRRIWMVDDAEALLDPLCDDALHEDFMEAIGSPRCLVVFALGSSRHLRFPEHCSVRIVFPTGDRTVDMMAGIPSTTLSMLGADDASIPGRAVLLMQSKAFPVQCHAPSGPGSGRTGENTS
ncbi:cell division protein FtsK [Bifidobacterium sp. 82T24]|nr:cell division protein FtsK [Bifidobacterium pluvialisilvae]